MELLNCWRVAEWDIAWGNMHLNQVNRYVWCGEGWCRWSSSIVGVLRSGTLPGATCMSIRQADLFVAERVLCLGNMHLNQASRCACKTPVLQKFPEWNGGILEHCKNVPWQPVASLRGGCIRHQLRHLYEGLMMDIASKDSRHSKDNADWLCRGDHGACMVQASQLAGCVLHRMQHEACSSMCCTARQVRAAPS